ncbi:caspase family protein [Rhodoferax aquaticus]|nr:caspase family protein [Rhodoferax aquaticus]
MALPWASGAQTLPSGMTVAHGQASSSQGAGAMQIVASDKAVLQWQQFSIGASNKVVFQLPSSTSQVLNQVTGQDPSTILGSLQSNGKVWLLNPNGVVFGAGARIDVAGLVASSLHMQPSDFVAGNYVLKSSAYSASVINQGTIRTPYGGQVLLMGPSVHNSGTIETPGGQSALLATSQVELVDTGTPFMAMRVPVAAGQVRNSGSVAAGRIDIYGAVVNQQGSLVATGMGTNAQGEMVLRASGNVDLTAGSETRAAGGKVTVESDNGTIAVRGLVDVSAPSGNAGSIDMHAPNLEVGNTGEVTANALASGDGGRIVLWGYDLMRTKGLIAARGGLTRGDGGFIETSTHGALDIQRAPSAAAPFGKAGKWLIDPYDITLVAGAGSSNIGGGPFYTGAGNTATLGVDLITTALIAGTNVSVATGGVGSPGTQAGDITVAAPITANLTGGNVFFELNAARDIYLNQPMTFTGPNSVLLILFTGAVSSNAFVRLNTTLNLNANSLASMNNAGRGTLVGSGVINGNTALASTYGIAPGGVGGIGSITINGDLSLFPGSSLQIDIGGTTPGSGYDQLNVSGNVLNGSDLVIRQVGGFVPQAGASFSPLTFGSVSGDFNSVSFDAASTSWGLTTKVQAGQVQLVTTNMALPGGVPTSSSTPADLWPGFSLVEPPVRELAGKSKAGAGGLNDDASARPDGLLKKANYSGTSGSILDFIPVTGLPGTRVVAANPDLDLPQVPSAAAAMPGYRYIVSDKTNSYFRVLPVASVAPAELDQILTARREYKEALFSDAVQLLRKDPAIADLPSCSSAAEAVAGKCLAQASQPEVTPVSMPKAKAVDKRKMLAALPKITRKLALVIGINKYGDKRIPQLVGALPDARAVTALLDEELGYDAVTLSNPSKAEIFAALNGLTSELGENDSLLVYYAGHGEMVDSTGMGYWIPSDGVADNPNGWVSNSDINKLLARAKSRQMAVIADSCYSGRFTAESKFSGNKTSKAIDELLVKRAVTMMSSGGDEPVADTGKEGHSVFAWNLMQKMREVSGWSSGGTVFEAVRIGVESELPQTPQYGASLAAGHEMGADFLFEKRGVAKVAP